MHLKTGVQMLQVSWHVLWFDAWPAGLIYFIPFLTVTLHLPVAPINLHFHITPKQYPSVCNTMAVRTSDFILHHEINRSLMPFSLHCHLVNMDLIGQHCVIR